MPSSSSIEGDTYELTEREGKKLKDFLLHPPSSHSGEPPPFIFIETVDGLVRRILAEEVYSIEPTR